MKTLTKGLLVTAIGAFLAGCSSSPNEELYERLAKMEERQMEISEKRKEIAQEKMEQELEIIPSWVLEPPESDGTGVYGVGIAESKKLPHGLRSARLSAEFEVGKRFNQELSGAERAFEQGDTEGNVTTQTTFLIDKIVDAVPVVGYEVVEQKVVPFDGVYKTYVLLKMPYDQFNKVLQAQRDKELDVKVQASFDDLERRLDKRRVQKEQQAQSVFEREQEALKSRAEIVNATGNNNERQADLQ